MAKISIYVANHRNDVEIIQSDIYRPMHVGRVVSKVNLNQIIGDDTGDNISHLNPLYCEMTAAYWAWKNDAESDYIGLCHYRRFFALQRVPFVIRVKRYVRYLVEKAAAYLRPGRQYYMWDVFNNPSKEEFARLTKQFESEINSVVDRRAVDIFCLRPVRFASHNVRTHFNILGAANVELLERIVESRHPDFLVDLHNLLNCNKMSYANMVIMKRELYGQYCEVLFDILEQHRLLIQSEGWCSDPMTQKCYSRMSGYMAELITATFVEHQRKLDKSRVGELTAINYGG